VVSGHASYHHRSVSAEPHRIPPGAALRIEQRAVGVVEVIELRGELDIAGAPALAARIDALRRSGPPARVLVDLCELDFCDSTGLRALIGAAGEVRAAGGRLVVSAGPGGVSRLLRITGAAEWLDIQPDAAAALATLTPPR
jgi:anti-sigma B factor antagonist